MNFIWDLDGTLVDSYPVMLKNLMTVFEGHGDYDEDEIYTFITDYSIKELFEREAANGVDIDKVLSEYYKVRANVSIGEYKLISGALEIIKKLNEKGHFNYIYTHRDFTTQKILKELSLGDAFVEIVTSENGFRRKPDSDGIDYLVQKYGMDKKKTYYVGDRRLDIESGVNAGVKTIFFNPEGKEIEEADFNVISLLEILDI